MANLRNLFFGSLLFALVTACAPTRGDYDQSSSTQSPWARSHSNAVLVDSSGGNQGQTADQNAQAILLNPSDQQLLASTHDPVQLLVIGKSAMKQANHNLAEAALLKSSALSPTVIDAHLFLGNLYFLTDRYQESRAEYQKALQLDSQNIVARNNMMLIDVRQAQISIRELKSTLNTNDRSDAELDKLELAIKEYLNPPAASVAPESVTGTTETIELSNAQGASSSNSAVIAQ